MRNENITIGILAHVDAGKTTLSESILYETGVIKKRGRVDHKDAHLDTYELEKQRGITIYAKQAVFPLEQFDVMLLDTPGHVDFSAEMERTLRVLDYAVLLISGTDGVQGHTSTVWKLLKRYHVPTFVFVNKMDMAGADRNRLIKELKAKLDDNCIDFSSEDEGQRMDELALCDELLMEQYIEDGIIDRENLQLAIGRRHVFPVYFGSALKDVGVGAFLEGLGRYMKSRSYPEIFGARVFKVIRDSQGDRLTYVKVTGGSLKVKAVLTNRRQRNLELKEDEQQTVWQEKVDQIRIYSGAGYETVKEAAPGTVCALTGLSMTKPGDGIGFESDGEAPALVPVLSYKVTFPEGTNIFGMLKNLRILEEEEPHLNVVWQERLSEIHVQVMGEIQIEILKSTIMERFGTEASFEKGNLVYRETVKKPVIGIGHFEPLKHYAEVHLMLEPLPAGSGMVYDAQCSEDVMDRNWQRLVLTHLQERKHPGVLTGAALTDVKVTLVAGRGHNKHTEGGDFREATFRALRQGLMQSENVLLEPVYAYTLEVPKAMLGRAMSDVERMHGRYEEPVINADTAVITGTGPAATMMHYNSEVVAYTRGEGRLSLSLNGYEPCHNQEEVIDDSGYDPETDADNPTGSVFCSKGVGYGVPWQEVPSHAHVSSGIRLDARAGNVETSVKGGSSRTSYSDDELEAVFTKTYGVQKERLPGGPRIMDGARRNPSRRTTGGKVKSEKPQKQADEKYLLVDGYNIVFAWDELKKLAEESLDAARMKLQDMLCNYQGQTGETVILVFDAYRVAGNRGEMTAYNNIHVVYTKEAETADQYIEKLVHKIRPEFEVTVATSDVVEQVIILGKGANRLSAEGLKVEMAYLQTSNKEHFEAKSADSKHRPFDGLLAEDDSK